MRIRPALVLALAGVLAWAGIVAWRVGGRSRAVVSGHASPAAPALTVPWPADGQASMFLEGIGSLGASGGQAPVPIASLAKVMTAYLVLRAHPLSAGDRGFTVTIGAGEVADYERRRGDDESTVAVAQGELLDERQLLQALLLPSANNIAAVLAVHEAGSLDAFVARMNDTAGRLGMRHTTYTDPSGLDPDTASTAADQLRVVRAALGIPAFAQIVSLRATSLPVQGEVANTNPLLGGGGFIGVKTGSDDAAGGCLAFATVRSTRGKTVLLIGVVLGQRGGAPLDAAASAVRPMVDAVFAQLAAAPR